MKHFYIIIAFFSIIFLNIFSPKIIHAQNKNKIGNKIEVTPPSNNLPGASNSGTNTVTEDFLPRIVSYVIGITTVLAIIAITWAGIQMFLSVGNEEKFNQARNILIYALIGVGLAGGAYLIVSVISNLRFTF